MTPVIYPTLDTDLKENLDNVLKEFDQIIGLDRLMAFHLNDSQNPIGSHKDRHALIGEGFLGLDTAVTLINHPVLDGLPFILETPTDLEGHSKEIAFYSELNIPCLSILRAAVCFAHCGGTIR